MVDFLASKTELNIQKAVILTFWSKIQIRVRITSSHCHFFLTRRLQRIKELVRLVEGAAKRAFGNSLKEMFYIDVLCSHPDYQGHGYGSAVLDTVTAMVRFTRDHTESNWLMMISGFRRMLKVERPGLYQATLSTPASTTVADFLRLPTLS